MIEPWQKGKGKTFECIERLINKTHFHMFSCVTEFRAEFNRILIKFS